jgi:hypothetical protein
LPEDLTEAHAFDPEHYWHYYGGRDKAVHLVGHAGNDFVTRSSTGKTLYCMDPMDPRVTYICNTIIPQFCRLARTPSMAESWSRSAWTLAIGAMRSPSPRLGVRYSIVARLHGKRAAASLSRALMCGDPCHERTRTTSCVRRAPSGPLPSGLLAFFVLLSC